MEAGNTGTAGLVWMWVALRILVGQHRSLRLEHRGAHDVLAGDQVDLGFLTDLLVDDELGNDLIAFS